MLTARYLRSEARAACHPARRSRRKSLRGRTIARLSASNRSVKPWSPSAVRGRRGEQNRRIACDCRHLQPRPGPSHHGLTEQLPSASNCSVKPWKNGRSASSPQRSSPIASVSPLSHQRSGWTSPRTGQPRGACQPRNPSTRLANRPYRSDTTGLISALCPQSRWRWKGDASSVARSA